MKANSKWNYVAVGINIMVIYLGIIIHHFLLLIIGVIFGAWNWFTAENLRRFEDEATRKSVTEAKE